MSYAASGVPPYCHLQFPFLVSSSPILAPYLPSLSQAQGCPHPRCAERLVHLGQFCVGHSPSTAKRRDEREEMSPHPDPFSVTPGFSLRISPST